MRARMRGVSSSLAAVDATDVSFQSPTPRSPAEPSPQREDAAGLDGAVSHRFLDSVARFTDHRDLDALDQSLTLSLAELTAARAVTLYKRADDAGAQGESMVRCFALDGGYGVEAAQPGGEQPWLQSMRRCAEQRQGWIERIEAGHCHVLVPIQRDGQALGALLLENARFADALRVLVEGFARIYANYTVLLHESERDKLTGLYNRRTFERQLQRLLAGGGPVWLAILDIDHFKRINDTYGHLYGDEVILLVARHMRSGLGAGDVLFRFGGEEFVALLGAPAAADAHAVLESLRARVSGHDFPQIGQVTVSIGFARIGMHDYPASVLDRADKALYYAKKQGRNRVEQYEALLAAGAFANGAPTGSVDLF